MPSGRRPRDEEELIFEQQKVEARERNLKRRCAQKKATIQKNHSLAFALPEMPTNSEISVNDDGESEVKDFVIPEHWGPWTRSQKLKFTVNQLLDRLIDESRRGCVTDVEFFDKESVHRRKAQLSNIKDLMIIVKQMRELANELEDIEAEEESTNLLSDANLVLIKDAKEALANIGIKDDL